MVKFRSAAVVAAIVGLLGSSALSAAQGKKARYARYAQPMADEPVYTAAPPPGAVTMHATSMPCPVHGVPMGCGQAAGCTCVPNARWFGYFPTLWRVWPCEPRPDKAFPQAIGSQVVPAPPGAERVPLPVETPKPPEAALPQDHGYRPPSAPTPPVVPPPQEPQPPAPEFQGPAPPAAQPKTSPDQPQPGLPPEPSMNGSGVPGPPPQPPTPFESAPPKNGAKADERTSGGGPSDLRTRIQIAQPETPIRIHLETKPGGSTLSGTRRPDASAPGHQVRSVPDVIWPDAPRTNRMAGTTFNRHRSTPAFTPVIDAVPQPPSPRPPAPGAAERPPIEPEPRVQAAASPRPDSSPPPQDAVQPWSQPRAWQSAAKANSPPPSQARASAASQASPPAVSQGNAAPAPPAVDLVQHVAPTPPQEFPLQLEGYCPVELIENEKWTAGDPQWAVAHRGRLYRMSGAVQQQRFLANPDRYTPVFSGMDPVLALEEAREVPGKTAFCAVYDGRLFVFSNAATLAKFRQGPRRYAAAAR